MADEASAGIAGLFDGELDPQIAALVTVVERCDGPRDLNALRIVGGVIVEAVVRQFFHFPSSARLGTVRPVMDLLRHH